MDVELSEMELSEKVVLLIENLLSPPVLKMFSEIVLTSLMYLAISVFLLLLINLLFNFYSSRKLLKQLGDKRVVALRPSYVRWKGYIKKHKNYSYFPYFLFVTIFLVGVYYNNMPLITGSLSFLVWKQISLFWPCTFVFTREGISFWEPFVMSVRKNFPDRVEWHEVEVVHYDTEHSVVVIKTKFEILYCPVKEGEEKELYTWLSHNFLSNLISYEFEKGIQKSTST